MNLIILMIVVLIVVGMLLWAVNVMPGLPDPPKGFIKVAIILLGVLVILHRGGLL
jgi:hypothetical protein